MLIIAFGATTFALMSWMPREKSVNTETGRQVNMETINPVSNL
jgi:hypothetical protein